MSADRIRELNDAFRQHLRGPGRVLLTRGVSMAPAEQQARVIEAVRTFEAFDPENDPYGDHDFGSFEVDGIRHFWKIDYYDLSELYASPDPADTAVTLRVLTIMLAEEY